MLQHHQGNGTRPGSSLTSKQTTKGKGGGTATNRQALRKDVTQLTTARNAIRCRRQSSSKETSRSFDTIRPKRKEPLIKVGSHNRDTHKHRQQLFTKAKKKPTDTIVHGRKKKLHIYGIKRSSSPTDHATVAMLPRQPKILSLIDISLDATGFFLRGHTAGGEGLLYHAKKSSIYHKKAPKQTVFFCLFANLS
jgi:hypothetical protein